MKLVYCWIEHPVLQINKPFTYYTDDEVDVETGVRVIVNFNHKEVVGFVDRVEHTEKTMEEVEAELQTSLKKIERVLDEESLITKELYDLALWLSKQTLSTVISCFQAMLPAKVKPVSHQHHIIKQRWVELSSQPVNLTLKQLELFEYIKANLPMTYTQLRQKSAHLATKLIELGVVKLVEKEKVATSTIQEPSSHFLPLTNQQQEVIQAFETSNDQVFLLKGVTGSGKTEVYLNLANQALKRNEQVLILVPEIALTPQMIARVQDRFGTEIAIFHSGLNAQEKYEQYRKVKNRIARIVVGTRSAVFLPFHNLGLIVMDEEHDLSYKQDSQPTYHCRDVVLFRANYHHCKVLLASATPSFESYARAQKKVYHLLTLDQRINRQKPTIHVVSMKEALQNGVSSMFSNLLLQKMQQRLKAHEQIILLLNRRGYHSVYRCRSCKEPLMCPHCDMVLSYHRDIQQLMCHTCGYVQPIPKQCSSCHSQDGFTSFGYGTQRVEEEIQHFFPTARLLRMDRDTTSKKNMHQTILEKFSNQEADILIGTQMVAKGLDFPNVTLVGILDGDQGLRHLDYRSSELTFDLLTQASGRSGRSQKKGEVVIQVFDPTLDAIRYSASQNFDAFYHMEMQYRHIGMYPPFSYFISIMIRHKNENEVFKTAFWLKENLKGDFQVLGPSILPRIKDYHRSRILLQGKNLDLMRQSIQNLLEENHYHHAVMLLFDVNPLVLE